MILSSYPSIDLHGMDSSYAIFKVKEFIDDCYKLKYEYLVIIHGIGKGILSKAVREYLKKCDFFFKMSAFVFSFTKQNVLL